MIISDLVSYAQKPALYEPGNSVMWTDPHISSQLLQVHLSEHSDLASRKPETIRLTADWILESFDFQNISFHSQVIPDGDGYTSEDVTFCLARNS